MTEAQARSEIEARFLQIIEAANKRDFATFASYHTENCTVMYQEEQTYRGRPAIAERMRGLLNDLSVNQSVLDEINYFELLNENTAYTNIFASSMDQTGKTVAKYRITSLWRKIDQEWFVDRKFMNYREVTTKDRARKEIEAQMIVLYDAFSRMDIEGALKVYSEEPTWLFQGQENINGKKDGFDAFMKLIPSMKTLVLDEIFYFELFGEDVAHTNAYVNLIDENGKVFNRIRDCFLWKKMDGKWLINRDSYNEVPLK